MLKASLLFLISTILGVTAYSQFTYKIKADSLKITGNDQPAELILENSTKDITGFLYNKGGGRTEFRGFPVYGDTSATTGNYSGKLLLDTTGSDAGVYIFYNNYWHSFSTGGSSLPGVQSISSSGSIASPASVEDLVKVDASAGPVALTLPSSPAGKTLVIKKMDATSNAISLTTLEGNMSVTTQYAGLVVRNDGSNWMLIQIF